MTIRTALPFVLAFVVVAIPTFAADEVEKILVPIRPERVVGAFGSEWVTDVAITNIGDAPL